MNFTFTVPVEGFAEYARLYSFSSYFRKQSFKASVRIRKEKEYQNLMNTKNPLPYFRPTQRTMWTFPVKKYEAWKEWVWQCLCRQHGSQEKAPCDFSPWLQSQRIDKETKFYVTTISYFCNNTRGDAMNIQKGIEDALADKMSKKYPNQKRYVDHYRIFRNDKNCVSFCSFEFDKQNPRVEVQVTTNLEQSWYKPSSHHLQSEFKPFSI